MPAMAVGLLVKIRTGRYNIRRALSLAIVNM